MSAPSVFPLQPMRTADTFSSLLHTRFQNRAKRGRGKAVSWPPEDQICQIRFFLSNDAPSSLGSAQAVFQLNHLKSSSTQSGYLDGSLDVPPGFHGSIAKRAKVNTGLEVLMSVGMPWFRPQKFVQECDWLVADGDESKEIGLQEQRELRVLEAFYPRLTSIPDSPAEPVEFGQCLDDSLVPIIPLVAIEEEDESGQGPEHGVKEEFESDMAVAEHGKLNDEQKPQLPTSGCLTHSHDSSKHAQMPTISKMDPKVAAAAAAAAACMAIHKFGANGLVDQELLVEILRNPALLKNLTFFNASRKDLAGPMNGNEVGFVGQPIKNPHIFSQCAGPLNKGCQGIPFNTGLPSPVSVLSDWTQEHSSKFLSRTPSNLSDTSNVKNVSSCMPPSLPFRHSHSTYPSRENVSRMESASVPLQGVHAFAQETGLGMKASHISNNASAQTTSIVHVDRSCGMVAPLAPFPSQNVVNFNSSVLGRTQPAQMLNAAAQIGVMHDSAPCRSSFSDARLRGMQNENPGLGSMSKTGPKPTRLCMYFNTPRGCRNGGSCAFLHQSANQELNPIAQ